MNQRPIFDGEVSHELFEQTQDSQMKCRALAYAVCALADPQRHSWPNNLLFDRYAMGVMTVNAAVAGPMSGMSAAAGAMFYAQAGLSTVTAATAIQGYARSAHAPSPEVHETIIEQQALMRRAARTRLAGAGVFGALSAGFAASTFVAESKMAAAYYAIVSGVTTSAHWNEFQKNQSQVDQADLARNAFENADPENLDAIDEFVFELMNDYDDQLIVFSETLAQFGDEVLLAVTERRPSRELAIFAKRFGSTPTDEILPAWRYAAFLTAEQPELTFARRAANRYQLRNLERGMADVASRGLTG